MRNIIPFTPEDVKAYLDKCITYWRGVRDSLAVSKDLADHYIDAYQSVRVSIFGETLK